MKKIILFVFLVSVLFTTFACTSTKEVKVSFYTDNTYSVPAELTVNQKDYLPSIGVASKRGYTFIGWFYDETLLNQFDISEPIVRNLVLYPKFKVNTYRLRFLCEGEVVLEKNVTFDTWLPATPNPIQITGHTFSGWFMNNIAYTGEKMPANDLDIIAKYNRNSYKIRLLNEDNSVNTTFNVLYGDSFEIPSGTNPQNKAGYDGIWEYNNISFVDSDTDIHPIYSRHSYLVRFIDEQGNLFHSENVLYQDKITLKESDFETKFVKTGFTFLGFYESLEDHTIVDFSYYKNLSISQNITVIVGFSPIILNYYFIGQNGQIGSLSGQIQYGSSILIPIGPNVTGRTFSYWYVGEDTVSNRYYPGNSYKLESDTIFNAKYNSNVYPLSFDAMEGVFSTGDTKVHTFFKNYNESLIDSINPSYETPTRFGYSFLYWCKVGTLTPFNLETSLMEEGGISLYAVYQLKTLRVYFSSEGGTSVSYKQVLFGSPFGILESPSRLGYTFLGWFYNDTLITSQTIFNYDSDITLVASWSIINYTITYVLSDGVNNPFNPTTYNIESETITFLDPSKEGHTFGGWFRNEALTNPITSINLLSTGNITVYAKFSPSIYSINYDAQGGSLSTTTKSVTYGLAVGSLATPLYPGYSFIGWYYDETMISSSTVYLFTSSIVVYAKYEIINYSITYEFNGGTALSAVTTEYNVEDETFSLVLLSKTGYIFNGWYKNVDFTGDLVGEVLAGTTGNFTLYAKFTAKEYVITLDPNGGSIGTSEISVTYNQAIGELPNPTKNGYTFNGWFDLGATLYKNDSLYLVDDDLTLFASYQIINYNIFYILSGGTLPIDFISSYTIETNLTLPVPVKEGYTFSYYLIRLTSGSFTNLDTISSSSLSLSTGKYGELRIEAIYTPNLVRVNLNTSGGVLDSYFIDVYFNSPYGTIDSPNRSGYSFLGWFFDNDTFLNEVLDSTVLSNSSTHTLYAKYEINEYQITYVLDDGINSIYNVTSYTVLDETIILESPSKEGYSFIGWYQENTFENLLISIDTSLARDVTIYAKYSLSIYEVTLFSLGTGNGTILEITYSTLITGLPLDSTRTGYNFTGWYYNDTLVENNDTFLFTSNITLVAHFSAKTTLITLMNGFSVEGSVTATYGEALPDVLVLEDAGHVFVGYFLEDDISSVSYYNSNGEGTRLWNIDASTINLYAIFSTNTHSLTIHPNNGSANYIINIEFGSVINLPNLVYAGHDFSGWYLNEALDEELNITNMVDNDLHIYAKWNNSIYQVIYYANTGVGSMSNTELEFGVSSPLASIVTYSKTGYYPSHFNTSSNDTGTRYEIGSSITLETPSNLGLYIIYAKESYTISFKDALFPTLTYEYGESLPNTSSPGYSFAGWYVSNENAPFKNVPDLGENLTSVELTPKFNLNSYILTYKNEFASDIQVPFTVLTNLTLSSISKNGYNFMGWIISSSNLSFGEIDELIVDLELGTGHYGNVILTASFEVVTYTITYNLSGGTLEDKVESYTILDTISLYQSNKTGYSFVDYRVSSTSGNIALNTFYDAPYTISSGHYGNVTFTANYEAISYTISYLNVYGNTTGYITSYTIETNLVIPSNSRLGYLFNGYSVIGEGSFLDESYFEANNLTLGTSNYGNIELTGDFELINYTISYFNTFDVSNSNSLSYNITSSKITLVPLERYGYQFVRFTLNSLAGTTITSIETGSTGNLNIYVVWEAIQSTVTLDKQNGTGSSQFLGTYGNYLPQDVYSAPSKVAYDFVGYFEFAGGTGTKYYDSEMQPVSLFDKVTNTTIYAYYTPIVYNIYYENTKGRTNTNDLTYTILDEITFVSLNDDGFGYMFIGFYTLDGTTTSEWGSLVTSISETYGTLTLYAKWEGRPSTVTFNSEGGSTVDQIITKYGEIITKPLDPTKTGFVFAGWYKSDTYLDTWNFSEETVNNSQIELFALWENTYYSYTLTYEYYDPNYSNTTGSLGGINLGSLSSSSPINSQIRSDIPLELDLGILSHIFSYYTINSSDEIDNSEPIYLEQDSVIRVVYIKKLIEVIFVDELAGTTQFNSRYGLYNSTFSLSGIVPTPKAEYIAFWNYLDLTPLTPDEEFGFTRTVNAEYYALAGKTIVFMNGNKIAYTAVFGSVEHVTNAINAASGLWNLNASGYYFMGWYTKDGSSNDWGIRLTPGNYSFDTLFSPSYLGSGNGVKYLYARWRPLIKINTPTNVVVNKEDDIEDSLLDTITISFDINYSSEILGHETTNIVLNIDGQSVNLNVSSLVVSNVGSLYHYIYTFNRGSVSANPVLSNIFAYGTHLIRVKASGDNIFTIDSNFSNDISLVVSLEVNILDEAVYDFFIIQNITIGSSSYKKFIFFTNMQYDFGGVVSVKSGDVASGDGNLLNTSSLSGDITFTVTKPSGEIFYYGHVTHNISIFIYGNNYQTYLREVNIGTTSYLDKNNPEDYQVGSRNSFHVDLNMNDSNGSRIPFIYSEIKYSIYLYGNSYELDKDDNPYFTIDSHNISFTAASISLKFRIVVKPNYASNLINNSLQVEFIVKVIDGYNAFTLDEFRDYFSNRNVDNLILHTNLVASLKPEQIKQSGGVVNESKTSASVPNHGNLFYRGFEVNASDPTTFDDFSVIGNYMLIDGRGLPFVDGNDPSDIVGHYITGYAIYSPAISMFAYNVKPSGTLNTPVSQINNNVLSIKNLRIVGNTTLPEENYSSGQTPEDILNQQQLMRKNSGGFDIIRALYGNIKVKNVIISSGVIGIYIDTTASTTLLQEGDVTPVRRATFAEIDYALISDIWGNSIYAPSSSRIYLNNSYLKVSGGPAIHISDGMIGIDNLEDQVPDFNDPALYFGNTNIIENYVTGDGAWFHAYLMNIPTLQMKGMLESNISALGKSIIFRRTNPVSGYESEYINLMILTEASSERVVKDDDENVIERSQARIYFESPEGTILEKGKYYVNYSRRWNFLDLPSPDKRISGEPPVFAGAVGYYSSTLQYLTSYAEIKTIITGVAGSAIADALTDPIFNFASFYNLKPTSLSYFISNFFGRSPNPADSNDIATKLALSLQATIVYEGINYVEPKVLEVCASLSIFDNSGYSQVFLELH
ncbi:MAG: InlB B-repeat-containing protein [Acholeplasmatales bacterium]|nr:InlB B-repeat-containing protein [Acholeplasmatales bacterium]